ELTDVEELVRTCGFYHTKAQDIINMCRMLITDFGGKLPDNMEDLLKLPGIGRKTANLVLGDIYGLPAIVCDTHCIRITNLLGLTTGKDPAKVEQQLRLLLPSDKSNDFCHRLVLFGREICIARRPQCNICPLNDICKSGMTK
ncbi:MAG: endonuclease III, partial [Angelakisella sp.]